MRRLLLVSTISALFPLAPLAADKPKEKPLDVPISKPGDKVRVVGKLGVPFGEVVTVHGVVVEGPYKGDEGGPNLRVQRINGKATQDDIQIQLAGDIGKTGPGEQQRPKLKNGTTYEFEGYETGGFVGVPWEAYKRQGLQLQTADHHFHHELFVYARKAAAAITWSPADFVGREALLEGTAVSRDKKAFIDGGGWQLLTDPAAAWPAEVEGKRVEGFGTVAKDASAKYQLQKGHTRLVKLDDQRGRAVSLRGTAWSMNGDWWFNYRGTDLYVEGMKELPGWTVTLHGRPLVITGNLDEGEMPDLGQLTLKINPGKKKYFVVRQAKWKPLDALLAPERVERE